MLKIINAASLLSFTGGLTKALANEWAAEGVQINVLAPGCFRTDNTQPLQDDDARYTPIKDRIPAGRWGEPEETRSLVVQGGEAVLSPGWSIHAGAGTNRYTFCWAMGKNQDFGDVQGVAIPSMK